MTHNRDNDDDGASHRGNGTGVALSGRVIPLLPSLARRRRDELLEAPDAAERVSQLPTIELSQLVDQLGLHDSLELIALTEPQQLRELLDLQVWRGDRIDPEELLEWGHALSTLPDGARRPAMAAVDVELIGFLVRSNARIYLLAEQEPPDEPAGLLYQTPDGWFALEIGGGPARAEQLVGLIEALYADDADSARRMLQNLQWEFPAELEEWSLRWRRGRLEDLGFADYSEALRLYAYLDPNTVSLDRAAVDRPPSADPEPLPGRAALIESNNPRGDDPLFARAVASVDDNAERERLNRAAVVLANLAMAADRVTPRDPERVGACLEALGWRLSIGLEALSRRFDDGDELARARRVLGGTSLLAIARVGHSLALDLMRRLRQVARDQQLTSPRSATSVERLDPHLRERLAPLLSSRPQFFDESLGQPRPPRSLTELEQAERWVTEAEITGWLVPVGARSAAGDDPPSLVDIFRTSVANRLLGRGEGPLDRASLAALLTDHVSSGELASSWTVAADALAAERLPGGATDELQQVAAELVARWLGDLQDELGGLSAGDLDLRFVGGLLVVRDG